LNNIFWHLQSFQYVIVIWLELGCSPSTRTLVRRYSSHLDLSSARSSVSQRNLAINIWANIYLYLYTWFHWFWFWSQALKRLIGVQKHYFGKKIVQLIQKWIMLGGHLDFALIYFFLIFFYDPNYQNISLDFSTRSP
jgi:hypothetical protein